LLLHHVICWVPGEDQLAFKASVEAPLGQTEGIQQVQVFELMHGFLVDHLIEEVDVFLIGSTLMNWEGLRSSTA
jgi:hypothetical protein